MTLSSKAFLEKLEAERDAFWATVMPQTTSAKEYGDQSLGREDVVFQMCRICWAELRQAEVCAAWISTTPEYDVELNLLRQIADELKHYRVQKRRLKEFGVDIREYEPVREWAAIYDWLEKLPTTMERIASHITHEQWGGLAQIQMSRVCDPETNRIYRDLVVPEEEFHHQLGRIAILKHATTPEKQALIYKAFKECLCRTDEVGKAFARRRRELRALGWPEGWWRMVGEPAVSLQ